jgi:predicted O-methyltransferase YrrM
MAKPEVDVFQNEWELDQMLAVVEREQPKRILEVGSWDGGTLWHWLQIAEEVVSIDDGMRRAEDWKQWADDANTDLILLQGLSQDAELIEKARELGPYDFIFIDADHTYPAVHADWVNFSPMIAEGGVFAFHDTQHIGDPSYGVEQLWNEITSQPDVRWLHIVMTNHCGIGMLWV